MSNQQQPFSYRPPPPASAVAKNTYPAKRDSLRHNPIHSKGTRPSKLYTVPRLETPEEIAAWIDERKKRYPRRDRIEGTRHNEQTEDKELEDDAVANDKSKPHKTNMRQGIVHVLFEKERREENDLLLDCIHLLLSKNVL